MSTATLDAAHRLARDLHARLVPIPERSKAPVLPGWQALRLEESDFAQHFGNGGGIGVLTGTPSAELIDVDIDATEALVLAPMFLPKTARRHGRPSKRASHWWYRVDRAPATKKWKDDGATDDKGMLVELRSTGCQTVVPPSVHPSGEVIEWEEAGEPESVTVEALTGACARLASATLLARHWPATGTRHEFSLALAGFLLRAGLDEAPAATLVESAARAAGDPEWADRRRAVRDTAAKLAAGHPVTGGPALKDFVPDADRVVTKLREWLGLRLAPDDEPWDAPLPLLSSGSGPAFPLATLPVWIRTQVEAVATALQVPADLPAMLGLSVLAAAVAGKLAVRVQAGWIEPLNLFTATVLPSGEGKSPAFAEAVAPLESWEARKAEAMRPVILEANTRRGILEARAKRARELAAKAKPADRARLEAEAQAVARDLAACVVPVESRLVADDVTPERLASMLHEQHGRMAIMAPEGGIFEVIAGRYSATGAPNVEVFLRGHTGETLRVDRGTRPSDFVRWPALTVAVTVQPDVLRRLHEVREFRGRGLLARFFYAIPSSRLGRRDHEAPPVPATIRTAYTERGHALLDLPSPPEGEHAPEPLTLPLSPGAFACWREFRRTLEPQLAPGAPLSSCADWAAKLPGGLARLAGLLHVGDLVNDDPLAIVEIVEVVSREPHAVSEDAMVRAVKVAEYLIAHAQLAFRVMAQDPAFGGGARILAWLRGRRLAAFTRRELHRALEGSFPRVEDLQPALALLVEYGYLRDGTIRPPGKRPSPRYLVNPALYDNLDKHDNRSTPWQDAAPIVEVVEDVAKSLAGVVGESDAEEEESVWTG